MAAARGPFDAVWICTCHARASVCGDERMMRCRQAMSRQTLIRCTKGTIRMPCLTPLLMVGAPRLLTDMPLLLTSQQCMAAQWSTAPWHSAYSKLLYCAVYR